MNKDSEEDKLTVSAESIYVKVRSPNFSYEESKLLMNLIKKYNTIILNKSTISYACRLKDCAWAKITKEYNQHGFNLKRSTNCLKAKWSNLKAEGNRLIVNLQEINLDELDEVTRQVVTLLCDVEHNPGIYENMPEKSDFDTSIIEVIKEHDAKIKAEQIRRLMDEEIKKSFLKSVKKKRTRSSNFTRQECKILLDCVKKEKIGVFVSGTSRNVNKMKSQAWYRITNAYNRQCAVKRTTKTLHNRFRVLKTLAQKRMEKCKDTDFNNKLGSPLDDQVFENIKAELNSSDDEHFEQSANNVTIDGEFTDMPYAIDNDVIEVINKEVVDVDDDDEPMDEEVIENEDIDLEIIDNNRFGNKSVNNEMDHSEQIVANNLRADPISLHDDPLSTVLSSDSGVEFTNLLEHNEVTKSQLELQNYKMETAKLERKRVEELIKADEYYRKCEMLAAALRLRKARLDALAAETQFPPKHPALSFTKEESVAMKYLRLSTTDIDET